MKATAVVAVLLLLASATSAQQAGGACGPDDARRGTWMAIPASSMFATAGDMTGAGSMTTAGPDGCVTSDSGPGANVHVVLPDG